MGELPLRLIPTNSAAAVEMSAGFNDELADRHLTGDLAAGNNFKAFCVDAAVEAPGYQNTLCADLAFHVTRFADDDFCLGFDVALDTAVDMQVIV